MWSSIPYAPKFIRIVSVSIDAATPETYLKVRRPGNFDSLLPNLEFLGNLRREGTIIQLNFNFVVQNKNYLEMEEFVRLGLSIGVDKIHFQRILNLSSIPDEEFLRNDIADPRNATYPDLMKMLENPIFDNNIVDLYTLIPSRSHFKDRFEPSDKT
jgi:MoaA/NifB/PqqE/SkfB family radical SAM enzyme